MLRVVLVLVVHILHANPRYEAIIKSISSHQTTHVSWNNLQLIKVLEGLLDDVESLVKLCITDH